MKITTSGRRLCWPSITVNWFTTSQSFVRVVKINQPDDFRADAAVLAAAFDGDAVHQHPMKCAVVGDE